MKTLICTFTLLLIQLVAISQDKYFTRNGMISFFSSTPMEDINAENYNATAILDTKTGAMEFSVLMKSFTFKKALMQEHFNENYVESNKYPKAIFKGKIDNIADVDFSKDGEYPVKVSGDLTLHGETNKISTEGKLIVKDGIIQALSTFKVKPEDYKIEIPSVVRNKIAEEIEVTVDTKLEEFKR